MIKIKELYSEVKRTGWALVLAAAGLSFILRSGRDLFAQQVGVLLWKLLLVGAAVFVSHRVRTQLFPYVDLSEQLNFANPHGGRVFLGICILTGAIILALCSGL